MPTYTVTHTGKTKAGRDTVFFDGKHERTDTYLVGNKTTLPPLGARIEADTSSSDFKGTMLWWLNSWKLCSDQPAQAEVKATVQASAVQHNAGAKWQQDEAVLRFVSNAIGQALSAMQIKSPDDIAPWASAALKAAQGVLAGKVADFDDRVGF